MTLEEWRILYDDTLRGHSGTRPRRVSAASVEFVGDYISAGEEESPVIARIATFEGGNAEEMRKLNNDMLVERGATALPPGTLRVMVLMKDESRWSVISFFETEETAAASEEQWGQMGDEIPESVRGKRVSVESFEVAFDVETVR
jgi:hypothetical protein